MNETIPSALMNWITVNTDRVSISTVALPALFIKVLYFA